MSLGVVVLGHGSKLDVANQGLEAVVEMIRQKMVNVPVETAFMSQASPSLSDAMSRLAEQKVNRIIVAPLFLFPGMHIKHDIPEMLATEQAKYEGEIEITVASNLGTDQRIADIMFDRIQEVL